MTHSTSPSDCFPMGFVHGNPLLTLDQGYVFRQLPSSCPGFADGEPCPAPPTYLQPAKLRFHSLIIAGESLGERFAAAVRAGRLVAPTRAYGDLPLSLDPHGVPWPRTLDRLDLFDPATRRYLQDYVRDHVRTQARGSLNDHIRLWGFDNEWEGRANYSPAARAAFGEWLKTAYAGDISRLNAAWGADHPNFDSAIAGPLPVDADHTLTPGRYLDWWHFQSGHFTAFLADLARLATETDPLHRGVVHKATQLTLEMPWWRERLLDQARFADLVRPCGGGLFGIDMYGHGDRQAYETSHVYHCIRPSDRTPGHGVMLCENNNHKGPAGQFSATQWRLLANGVKGMMYFTTGYAGGTGDWDHFAFLEPATGRPEEKMFYAPRWANHVRRLGRFWTDCVPAPGMPRLALLLPKRDILLSPPSDRNPGDKRYAYPRNHRWLFFRWLREQGHWIDVIPCTKLSADYLRDYQVLCLIGAEHLTGAECDTVAAYVRAGGVLMADARAGLYDEHHRPLHQLDSLLGVTLPEHHSSARADFPLGDATVTACNPLQVEPCGAVHAAGSGPQTPPAFRHAAGSGAVLYLPFEAGSLATRNATTCRDDVGSSADTAESEEYPAFPGEFIIGRWLGELLAQAGVSPATRVPSAQEIARVEQPLVDADGNCAVVVSTRAHSRPPETIPAGSVELPLPHGPWTTAYWAPAETNAFQPVPVRSLDASGRHRIELPEIATAGVVHFFKSTPPLLGLLPIAGSGPALDPFTTQVRPGVAFEVVVQLLAPSAPSPGGTLHLDVPPGWTVSPRRHATPPLLSGGLRTFPFTVTPDPDDQAHKPDWLTPLTARWSDGKTESTAFSCVEVVADPKRIPHLLTDNAGFPQTYPYLTPTGATYSYLAPADAALIADPLSAGDGHLGGALTNGFGSIGGLRHSHHRDILRTNHIARYRAEHVDILFDLKSERDLMKVVLVTGAGPVYPSTVRILTGSGDNAFAPAASIVLHEPLLEIEIPIRPPCRGRCVRVQIDWPASGGTLDEIEIWGR